MNKEEEEAIVEMFSKLASMKYTYMNIINTAKIGVNEIVKKAGVPKNEMAKLREEGELRSRVYIREKEKLRSREAIRANDAQKNQV